MKDFDLHRVDAKAPVDPDVSEEFAARIMTIDRRNAMAQRGVGLPRDEDGSLAMAIHADYPLHKGIRDNM